MRWILIALSVLIWRPVLASPDAACFTTEGTMSLSDWEQAKNPDEITEVPRADIEAAMESSPQNALRGRRGGGGHGGGHGGHVGGGHGGTHGGHVGGHHGGTHGGHVGGHHGGTHGGHVGGHHGGHGPVPIPIIIPIPCPHPLPAPGFACVAVSTSDVETHYQGPWNTLGHTGVSRFLKRAEKFAIEECWRFHAECRIDTCYQ